MVAGLEIREGSLPGGKHELVRAGTYVHPVLFLLSFNIELSGFAGNSPDRFVEITVAPEVTSPKLILDTVPLFFSDYI